MKKRFIDEQIVSVLKEQEAGERMYIFGCGVGFREASAKEVIINFFNLLVNVCFLAYSAMFMAN